MTDLQQRLDMIIGLVGLVLAHLTHNDLVATVLVVLSGAFIILAVWSAWREVRRD